MVVTLCNRHYTWSDNSIFPQLGYVQYTVVINAPSQPLSLHLRSSPTSTRRNTSPPKALEEVEFKGSGLHITKSPEQQPALFNEYHEKPSLKHPDRTDTQSSDTLQRNPAHPPNHTSSPTMPTMWLSDSQSASQETSPIPDRMLTPLSPSQKSASPSAAAAASSSSSA